jgi:hypothetical protein
MPILTINGPTSEHIPVAAPRPAEYGASAAPTVTFTDVFHGVFQQIAEAPKHIFNGFLSILDIAVDSDHS